MLHVCMQLMHLRRRPHVALMDLYHAHVADPTRARVHSSRLAALEAQLHAKGLSEAQRAGLLQRVTVQRYQLRILQVQMLETQRAAAARRRRAA